ncbi:MAG: L,D-transpeptidase family protein [Pseudolabrys sp.]|nr:L,D-transpeptidase family protein [Pseudolabrys sp.]
MSRRPFRQLVLASAATAAAIALAGCDTDNIVPSGRAQAPLSDKMVAELEAKQMDKGSPILLRLFKEDAEAEVWKQNTSGEYALLKTYPICRWSGDLGPKIKEGDRQAPEGFYTITPGQMNPNSNYYLAFNMGYPNAYDRSLGRTGSELMIHGDCSSRGCYAMTDEQIVEIYALARESFFGGQKAFQVQAYPFRMTAENLAKHRNSPHLAFWKMLKNGSDHFEVTHQEPKVNVCEKRYVFDAAQPEASTRPLVFNAAGKCPLYEVQKDVAELVREKQHKDNAEYASLVNRNVSVVASRNGVDGGMNPVFLAKLNPVVTSEMDSRGQVIIPPAATPGALPREPNHPPRETTIPLQPKTEVAAADDNTPSPASLVRVANVPTPREAPQAKVGTAPEEKPTSIGGLIGSLFGGKSEEPPPVAVAAAEPEPQPKKTVASRVKGAVVAAADKAKDTAKVVAGKAKELVARKKPAADESRIASNNPAPTNTPLRSRIDDATQDLAKAAPPKDNTPSRPAAPQQQQPAQQPQPQLRTAFTTASGDSGSSLSGAAPVLPAGSFNSRFYGTR